MATAATYDDEGLATMPVIAWLGIPVAATLLAVAWVFWVSRPKPPADMNETLESYQRFKAAMSGEQRRRWRRPSRPRGGHDGGLR